MKFVFIMISLLLFPGIQAKDSKSKPTVKSSLYKPSLWSARSKGHNLYLFGSVHVGEKNMYPLPKAVTEAYQKSTHLAVEIDITHNVANIQETIQKYAFYKNSKNIKSSISKPVLKDLEFYLKKNKLPLGIFIDKKPWYIAMNITMTEANKLGYSPDQGIDLHFLKKAKKQGKKIVELESLLDQLKVFGTLSEADQENFLKFTLKNLETHKNATKKLIDLWKSGNEKSLWSFVKKEFVNYGSKGLQDELLYKRNLKMIQKIISFLKTKNKYFVVVGAAHLLGKKGIIDSLKSKGFEVKRINY